MEEKQKKLTDINENNETNGKRKRVIFEEEGDVSTKDVRILVKRMDLTG